METNMIPYSEVSKMAQAIGASRMFGQTAEQSLALMLVAQAEGRHPAIVARDYHVIQGRPALKADAMMARFQDAGGRVEWHSLTDTKAEATFSHPAGGKVRLAWTIEMANKAGLTSKSGPWKQFPRAMLRARLISEGIRTVFPGVLVGTYTPEEVADFDKPAPTPVQHAPRQEKDITPPEPEPVIEHEAEPEPEPATSESSVETISTDDAIAAVKAAVKRIGQDVIVRLQQAGLPARGTDVTEENARAVWEFANACQ